MRLRTPQRSGRMHLLAVCFMLVMAGPVAQCLAEPGSGDVSPSTGTGTAPAAQGAQTAPGPEAVPTPAKQAVTPGSELAITVWKGQTIYVYTRARVGEDGKVGLPRLSPVKIDDMTLEEVLANITTAYRAIYPDCSVDVVPVALAPPRVKPFGTQGVPAEAQRLPGQPQLPELPQVEQPAPTPVTAAQTYAALPRFGADVFISSRFAVPVERPQQQPTELQATTPEVAGSPLANVPVSPDYRIGPADALNVQIWSLNRKQAEQLCTVTADGYITLPVLGKVIVNGKTPAQVQELIGKRASEFYTEPQIMVELARARVIDVYVIGDVMQPGKFALPGNATVFTALYAAGGPSETGSYRRIKLVKPGAPEQIIDMYEYLMHGRRDADEMLQAGDTVFVPPVANEIGIAGAMRRPARYELLGPASLRDAIEMGSGFKPDAYASSVEVWRADERRVWNLIRADATTHEGNGLDMSLLDGDLVHVGTIVDRAFNTVELWGPVNRPGVYEATAGLTVGKLLDLAQGPTERAYIQHAAIWRLNQNLDYELIRFSVRDAMDGKDDPPLQPQDIVYIYTEDDVQSPPVVSVAGQIRKPGDYPFIEKMTVRELVMMAGDLLPGAYTERAEILRLTPDQRRRIIPIDLAKATQGGENSTVVLQRGDILNVMARDDVTVKSEVYADGYVRTPGGYPRHEGMRVSDAIVAAGGLQAGASDTVQYTPGRFAGGSNSQILALKVGPAGFTVEPDLVLSDDDRVGVMGQADFTAVPKVSSIQGRVARPGTYALRLATQDDREADTVYDLIQRAGGLLEDANPNGMILYRIREEVIPEDRGTDLSYVMSMLNREAGHTSAVISKEQEGAILSESAAKQFGGLLGTQNGALLVVPPRNISIAQWISAIPIEGGKILETKGAEGNMKLHDGDVLRVPKAVDFVTVIGSVSSPGALKFQANRRPGEYVEHAGGAMPDANLNRIVVMRANGAASPAARIRTIEPGDVIIVPSQYMFRTERIKPSWHDTFRELVGLAAAALVF